MTELIEQIHADFDSAQERMLKEAKRIINNPHDELASKAVRLTLLGFSQSKPTKIGNGVIARHTHSLEVIEAIEHFAQHYPHNKFITEEEVKRICEKYHLVLGNADKYIGDIPEKNIDEIEKFTLRDEDIYEPPERFLFNTFSFRIGNNGSLIPQNKEDENKKPRFKIVAPLKDFERKDTKLEGYKLEIHIPDPIVLQPVKNGYLIVSKWGLEASDKLIQNPKQN